jgi:hypothetical protein
MSQSDSFSDYNQTEDILEDFLFLEIEQNLLGTVSQQQF